MNFYVVTALECQFCRLLNLNVKKDVFFFFVKSIGRTATIRNDSRLTLTQATCSKAYDIASRGLFLIR